MKYTHSDQSITTDNLLDAIRRGQVFSIEVVPFSVNMPGWRVNVAIVMEGHGLFNDTLRHNGSINFPTQEEAQAALLAALDAGEYRDHLHLYHNKSTLCRLPHNGQGRIPRTAESSEQFASETNRCPRCWVNWIARKTR